MTLPVPVEMTAAVGSVLTAAEWNSNVRDGINFLVQPPLFVGYQTTGQSIANSTFTPLAVDTSVDDSYSGHSNTVNNSRYTAQVAGWYDVSGIVVFAANGTGVRKAILYVNGAPVNYYSTGAMPTSASSSGANVGGRVYLTAGSYVEMWVYQSSGGALSTAGGFSSLTAKWVHS